MSITAILFDLDNTLVPELPSYELAFASATEESAGRLGFNRDALRTAVFDIASELWLASSVSAYCLRLGLGSPTSLLSDFPGDSEELAYLRAWAPSYRRETWVRGLARIGISDAVPLALELDRAFRESLLRDCVAYHDVMPVLDGLSRRYALAVATNGPADVQSTKLIASGLQRFFPVVVASSEVGFGKPDPRIFITAIERVRVAKTNVIVVGDSLEKDVAGAAAAQLRCVWVNRTGARRDARFAPDFEIDSLAALPSLLL